MSTESLRRATTDAYHVTGDLLLDLQKMLRAVHRLRDRLEVANRSHDCGVIELPDDSPHDPRD